MSEHESGPAPEQAQRRRRDRTIAVVAFVGIIAAVVWRFIAPWTGLRADIAFIVVMLVGVLAATRLTRR